MKLPGGVTIFESAGGPANPFGIQGDPVHDFINETYQGSLDDPLIPGGYSILDVSHGLGVSAKDAMEGLETTWDDLLENLGGSPLLGVGGGMDFPEWPGSEKRHTGGPSSGDFYMDLYSGGLEGGNLPSKKYGLGAPENANYRGVLGVY